MSLGGALLSSGASLVATGSDVAAVSVGVGALEVGSAEAVVVGDAVVDDGFEVTLPLGDGFGVTFVDGVTLGAVVGGAWVVVGPDVDGETLGATGALVDVVALGPGLVVEFAGSPHALSNSDVPSAQRGTSVQRRRA